MPLESSPASSTAFGYSLLFGCDITTLVVGFVQSPYQQIATRHDGSLRNVNGIKCYAGYLADIFATQQMPG